MLQDRITTELSQCKYPELLRRTGKVPARLYVQSLHGGLPQGHYIAMVGTRRPSASASELCRRLVKSLAGTDAVIVSGLAQGIDSYCHSAALEFGLKTVAVLAQGLELRIPGDRGQLANEIVEQGGALLSEFPGNMDSRKGMFVSRNRIIAGLAHATIVVESKAKGGSLITADFAKEYARELFACPGNFDCETSQGPLELLRKGLAKPIFMPEDLRGLCGLQGASLQSYAKASPKAALLSPTAQALYAKFAGYTKTLTELANEPGMNTGALFAILTELELAGLAASSDRLRYIFEKD